MSAISIVLVIVVAFFAGMEGILDEWQFHQPLVACTLIGLVTGHPTEGIMLGGSLQMMALGWANVGAAVAPDAALASVASAIIMVLGLQGGTTDATSIHLTKEGIPTGVLSVPTRYIHTTVSVASLDDVENTIELIVKAIESLE